MPRALPALAALAALLALAVCTGSAAASGPRVARFDVTVKGDQTTNWSIPYQSTGASCYDHGYEEGHGSEHVTLRLPATKVLAFSPARGAATTLTLGTWRIYHPATARGKETIQRDGEKTFYDKPGTCGTGGGPTTDAGPYDCGGRSASPVFYLGAANNRLELEAFDTRHQLKPYDRCPILYPSSSPADQALESIAGKLRLADLFNKHKHRVVAKATRKWAFSQANPAQNTTLTAHWTATFTRH